MSFMDKKDISRLNRQIGQLQDIMTGRRSQNYGRHTFRGPERDKNGDPWMWHATRPLPWKVRQENRRRNRVARRARKVNR